MLDKNPNQDSTIEISKVGGYLDENTLTSVLCKEPFIKAAFLSKLIDEIDASIIYLDFDLLYSGYVKSKILSKNSRVSLFTPSKNDWNSILKKILLMVLNQKFVVIIDSLNGLYNLFDEKDIGRLVNAYIMLLVFVAKESNSSVLFSGIIRKKEENGWVLSPTGRHVIDTKMTRLYLKKYDSGFTIDIIDDESEVNSTKII